MKCVKNVLFFNHSFVTCDEWRKGLDNADLDSLQKNHFQFRQAPLAQIRDSFKNFKGTYIFSSTSKKRLFFHLFPMFEENFKSWFDENEEKNENSIWFLHFLGVVVRFLKGVKNLKSLPWLKSQGPLPVNLWCTFSLFVD